MRPTALRTLASAAVVAALSFPHDSASQTCSTNDAARDLLAGAYSDAILNPPSQEDNQFFTSEGGVPNVFFLIDTSGSMLRLPPNGPPNDDAYALPPEDRVGCGYDPEFGGTFLRPASTTLTPALDVVAGRTYHSPCGTTSYEDLPYQGHVGESGGVDYALAAAVCPGYYNNDPNRTGRPGYDPDFYRDSNSGDDLTSGAGDANLFPKNLIFHEARYGVGTWSRSFGDGSNPNGDYDDGWAFDNNGAAELYPWKRTNSDYGDIAEFCAAQGTTRQGTKTRAEICDSCLKKKGFYYDGKRLDWGMESGTVHVPSLWYTGNYLSFFPPKFVIARKIVKDAISKQKGKRFALAQFGSSGFKLTGQNGFEPNCGKVGDANEENTSINNSVGQVNDMTWGGGTPLAAALFDVGRYYHTPSLPWFGNAWEKNDNQHESDPGALQLAVCYSCQISSVVVITDGVPSDGDGSSLPTKASSIASSNSGKFAGDTTTGVLTPLAADCPRCYDFRDNADTWPDERNKNNLAKVAFYLHNYDLRGEPPSATCSRGNGETLDGKGMPGKQTLDVYTLGFGTRGLPDANKILANAAEVGGGIFYDADSASDLKEGLKGALTEISSRATSFSVATVSTLQTTTGHSVIVPRFDPSKEAAWSGHLYRFELYSEFVNDCTPDGEGDYDCDGLCASVFLQDKNGKFIGEDGSGAFMQTTGNLPPCSQTPRCVALAKSCGTLNNTPATPWWDAYEALKNMGWKDRYVWTVTDTSNDGKLTSADAMLRLATDDDTADKLIPYLGLGGGAAGVCGNIAARIETKGDPVTAQVIRDSKRECAKTIIRWLLGADVLNDMGRNEAQGWPPPRPNPALAASATNLPNQDQLLDRRFKLGDIYHSSPVVVDAPLPADGILCPNGLHNQCLESLWRTPVQHVVPATNQYDLYAKSAAYKNRRKIILVGSNDGLFHALNGGAWHANADDPVTTAVDEREKPFEGYYDRGEANGPVELWAFLPPDLLGKIPLLLGTQHHLYVDGTAMVRDVWVDGVANDGIASPGAVKDGKKAASEFHTVAVVGERRGGTHYFALDVTEATKLPTESGPHRPKFLWIYPQPNDARSLAFGETYTEFLPVPPPVGPVRIKADANASTHDLADASNAPLMYVPETPTAPVPYHELWVALLPGGYDPSYLRGRGVHMVDVWRGTEVFDFSWSAARAADDPRRALNYPVAATPAMVMWGMEARRASLSFENDGYFDTATFGDTGGQLWVLRFNRPATLDSSGRATNWFGGRILGSYWRLVGADDTDGSFCTIRGNLPFFYITANTALPTSHIYRVYAGTGDRFNLLDKHGGTCGPDNLRACAQRGCNVTLTTTNNVLSATGTGYDARGIAQTGCSVYTNEITQSQDVTGAAPSCGTTATVRVVVSGCPSGDSFTKDVKVTCAADADGHQGCTISRSTGGNPTYGQALEFEPPYDYDPHYGSRNWYFSLRVFEDTGARDIFDDEDGAKAYDQNRMYFSDKVTSVGPPVAATAAVMAADHVRRAQVINGALDNPSPLGSATGLGWAIYYNHGPTIVTEGHTYTVNPLDERTSSVSGLYGKVLWNTIQTALAPATATDANTCGASVCQGAFRRLSYHYAADAVTGGPVLRDESGVIRRSIVQNTLVPAQGDQPTVFVNQKGQIAVGLTAVNAEKGASNLGMGAAMDPVMGLGVIEVSRDLHDCRHFKPQDPNGNLTVAERAALTQKCAGK